MTTGSSRHDRCLPATLRALAVRPRAIGGDLWKSVLKKCLTVCRDNDHRRVTTGHPLATGASTARTEPVYSTGLKNTAHWIAVTTIAAARLTRRTRFTMTLLAKAMVRARV